MHLFIRLPKIFDESFVAFSKMLARNEIIFSSHFDIPPNTVFLVAVRFLLGCEEKRERKKNIELKTQLESFHNRFFLFVCLFVHLKREI